MLCQGKCREVSTFWPEDQGTLLGSKSSRFTFNSYLITKELIFLHVLLEKQKPNQTKPRKALVLTY